MNQRNYFLITGCLFAVVFLMHLIRILNGWTVILGPWTIPLKASWIGLMIAGMLSVWGFWLTGKAK